MIDDGMNGEDYGGDDAVNGCEYVDDSPSGCRKPLTNRDGKTVTVRLDSSSGSSTSARCSGLLDSRSPMSKYPDFTASWLKVPEAKLF